MAAEKEVFVPPREIRTERLIIRPFESAEEEIYCIAGYINGGYYSPDTQSRCESQEKWGYYEYNHKSPYVSYAAFSKDKYEFIGFLDLSFNSVSCLSSHDREICSNVRNHHFGSEFLKAILENVVQPSIGKAVEVIDTKSGGAVAIYEVRGHCAITMPTNYGSVFSNINGGMSIAAIFHAYTYMLYGVDCEALDVNVVSGVFKALSKYNGKDSGSKEKLKVMLQEAILSLNEPYTVLNLADMLSKKCNHIDNINIFEKVKYSYQQIRDRSEELSLVDEAGKAFNYDAQYERIMIEASDFVGKDAETTASDFA